MSSLQQRKDDDGDDGGEEGIKRERERERKDRKFAIQLLQGAGSLSQPRGKKIKKTYR